MIATLATYYLLAMIRSLIKRLLEISEYVGVLLDQFLELENDERKLLLIDFVRIVADTVFHKVTEQVPMVLPNDGRVLGEPSNDGTTVAGSQRHSDIARIANGHPENTLIGKDDSQLKEREILRK